MTTTLPSKQNNIQALDALTGGAFTAATSGERAAKVRDWLGKAPTAEAIAEVFKELSGRDKGAAKPLREKLDEIKRAKGQEVIALEWAAKAQALLDVPKLNIADALAWQRDAAKAGAWRDEEGSGLWRQVARLRAGSVKLALEIGQGDIEVPHGHVRGGVSEKFH